MILACICMMILGDIGIYWFTDVSYTKMQFSIKDFSSKCDQIRILQRIWSHLLKKSLMENLIFFFGGCYKLF